MSERVAKILKIERILAELKVLRLQAEEAQDALVFAAIDHEQRSMDQHRQELKAGCSDAELAGYEVLRHRRMFSLDLPPEREQPFH